MIHVAIVGTGGISHSHIKGLLTFPERCRIVALCDIVPGKAQQVKEQYHLDCDVFEDHKEMLEAGPPIDLVHVCTPPFAHAEVSIHAMEAGCNVLCEKPMAASLAECDAMLRAEKENGVVLGQVAQNRFTNPYWKLKKVLDSGLASVTSSVVHHGEEQSIIVQCANAKLSAPWNPKAEVSMGNGFPADGGNKALLKALESLSAEEIKVEAVQ